MIARKLKSNPKSFITKSAVHILLIILAVLTISCERIFFGKEPSNDPVNNFESLWTTVDEKYSFFTYKGIDWDSVYKVYRPQVYEEMTDEDLFDVLFDMLCVLKDGHVNLWSPFDISRYEAVFLESPQNFNYGLLQRKYLGTDYKITGSLTNTIIDSVGYIYYGSFVDYIDGKDIDYVLERFRGLKGIIIDVRDNGGGIPDNGFTLAGRFTNAKKRVYDSYVKSGKGQDDFEGPNHVNIEPGGDYQYTGKTVVLANRSCYSATNMFVAMMSVLPHVTIIGDTTGGGGGAPTGAELPNGWFYRFSATKTVMSDGLNIENGIPPDIIVDMDPIDEMDGFDSILERALKEFE